ncbi:MAG: lysyl oxidase family protein [Actinomycetota bacterium]
MRRHLLPFVLLVLVGISPTGTAASVEPGDVYLPDLRTVTPSDFHLVREGGTKLLLLSNTIWNGGDGPLEMRPEHDLEGATTDAYQLLFTETAEGSPQQIAERYAGSFAFHKEHDHWHFQDLARYELFEMRRNGKVGRRLAFSEKISFCMFDQVQIDPTLENARPDPLYSGNACDQNANVGYSVSWGDEYAYDFADQDVDVTGVRPGRYWVVSTADPEHLISETDDTNNAARVAIEIERDRARRLSETRGSICSPCGAATLVRGRRYTFEGTTSPTPMQGPMATEPVIRLSFKRAGAHRWRPMGRAGGPFALTDGSHGSIGFDGSWSRAFTARRAGTWVLRARYRGDDVLSHSSAKVRVEVTKP